MCTMKRRLRARLATTPAGGPPLSVVADDDAGRVCYPTFPASAASDLTCESLTVLAKDRKCRQRSDHHTSPLYTAMEAAIRRRPLPGVSVAYRKANRRAAAAWCSLARQDGRVPSPGHCFALLDRAMRPPSISTLPMPCTLHGQTTHAHDCRTISVSLLLPPSSSLPPSVVPALPPYFCSCLLPIPSTPPSLTSSTPSLLRHHPCALTNKSPHVSTRTAKPS